MKTVNRPALRLTLVGILSAVAFLLTYLNFHLLAPFLDFEMSELPIIVLGIVLGPLEAILSEIIKNILGVIFKPVANGLGQVANFVITSAYIVPLLLIYRAKDSFRRFVVGCAAGVAVTVAVAIVANYFVLIPLYAAYYHWPVEAIVSATSAMNPMVGSLESLVIFSVAPFNFIKAVSCSIVGYFVVMAAKPALLRMRLWPK